MTTADAARALVAKREDELRVVIDSIERAIPDENELEDFVQVLLQARARLEIAQIRLAASPGGAPR